MGTGWRLSPLSAFLLWELLWKTTLPRTFADRSSQVGVGWGEEMLNFQCEEKADFLKRHRSFQQHNKDSNYKIRFMTGDTYSSRHRLLYEKVGSASLTVRRDRQFLFVSEALDDDLPSDITSLLIWSCRHYLTRSWDCIEVLRAKTKLGKTVFSALSAWI